MPAWNISLSGRQIPVHELIIIALYQMPLASISDLANCLGLGKRTLRVHVASLKKEGKVVSCALSATRRAAARLHLSDDTAHAVGFGYAGWNSAWGRSLLLQHLPMLEQFYVVAAQCCESGRVHGFQWIYGDVLDAAVRLNDRDWIGLIWSGHWETELALYQKMLSIDDDLRRMGVSATDPSSPDPTTRPATIVFVTSDLWQAELVKRAAFRAGMTRWIKTYCAASGEWPHGRIPPLRGRGYIYWPIIERDLGTWPWERRLADAPASRASGMTLYKVAGLLTQWPGANITDLSGLAGGERLDRLADAMEFLIKHGRARRTELGRPASAGLTDPAAQAKSDVRYGPGSKTVTQVADRDRVNRTMSSGSSRALTWDADKYLRQRRHEDLLLRVMAALARKKHPVAAGWRCSERFPGGGISPDGLAFLEDGWFGPGWYYVEVELSAVSYKRLLKRLGGYLSADRRRHFPGNTEPPAVLFVVKNERVERVFHKVVIDACGGGTDARILTIPAGRWKANAPLEGWNRCGDLACAS